MKCEFCKKNKAQWMTKRTGAYGFFVCSKCAMLDKFQRYEITKVKDIIVELENDEIRVLLDGDLQYNIYHNIEKWPKLVKDEMKMRNKYK